MSKAVIPQLPPLSSITDPAVRAYLKALTDAWNVRNGYVGSGGEKFVTQDEMTAYVKKEVSGG